MSNSDISPMVLSEVPMAGDVALVLGPKTSSWLLVLIQRLSGRRQAAFSHVMLSLGGDLWCQAMPGTGVAIATTEEVFLAEDTAPIKIKLLRPPAPTITPMPTSPQDRELPGAIKAMMEVDLALQIYQKWLLPMMYFCGQRYNFLFMVPKFFGDATKFCSELVAAVMKMLKISPFSEKRSTSFSPADLQFDRQVPAGWSDQTEMLTRYLETARRPGSRAEWNLRATELRDGLMNTFNFAAGVNRQAAEVAIHDLKTKIALPNLGLGLAQAIADAEKAMNRLTGLAEMCAAAPWVGGVADARDVRRLARKLRQSIADAKRALEPR